MGRMHGVREQHGLVVAQGIQQLFVARDESLLLFFVELARNDIRLVIFEPQAMQQRDQSRAAFVNEAEFLLDPGADLARRARQRRGDPGFQLFLLLAAQLASAALVAEARQPLDPVLFIQAMPSADGVVVQQQDLRNRLAAHPIVEQHQRVRTSGQTMSGRPVPSQLDQALPRFSVQKARPYHPFGRIRIAPFGKGGLRILGSRGIL